MQPGGWASYDRRMDLRSPRRCAVITSLLTPLILLAAACAPADDTTATSSGSTSQSPSATGSDEPPAEDECATGSLPLYEDGTLTIATDSPAFEPWFVDDDPTNGEGYESAVAYAVADELGFSDDEVTWVTVPFNSSYQPGTKKFDFDINQISITAKRAEAVTFSDGYYSASQALITLKDSAYAGATSLADFKDAKIGAQVGTTSLDAVTNEIAPDQQPFVYDDTNNAKQALLNGQVDAIVSDLPTAFYITAVEIPQGQLVGQFQVTSGGTEQFGLLFEKGNPLVDCVNAALAQLQQDGTIAAIEKRWLSNVVDVPELD